MWYHSAMAIELNDIVAVRPYANEQYSIAAAASLAGVTFDQMKEILAERGVPLRLGPASVEEAQSERDALRRMKL
jgi:predicted HTH domain antitoxin